MDRDPAQQRETYRNMSDGELLALAAEMSSLESVARRMLKDEFRRRRLEDQDVSAFQTEIRAEKRKQERLRRKRCYRFLVGAGGPWETAYSICKWGALGGIGAGYVVRRFARSFQPTRIVLAAVLGFFAIGLTAIVALKYVRPGKGPN